MKGISLFVLLAFGAFAQTPFVNEQSGIVNNATMSADQGVAPGSIVSIFGSELASSLAQSDTVPLSTAIGDVSVSFNDVQAPVAMVSPNQVNVQVPWDLLQDKGSTGSVAVVVRRNGVASEARQVQLNPFSPGIYTLPFGFGQAVAVNADGSLAAPASAIPGTTSAPAKQGAALVLFATGLGAVDPPLTAGADSRDRQRVTVTTPTVLIGDKTATVTFSGLAPVYPGVYQINLTVPADAPTGNAIPVVIQIGGAQTTQRATIAIQ